MLTLRTLVQRAPLARLSLASSSSTQPHLISLRTRASSTKCSGEGMGKKESVGGSNPVTARAHGVKQAAKSVAEGATGVAQKATGVRSPPHLVHTMLALTAFLSPLLSLVHPTRPRRNRPSDRGQDEQSNLGTDEKIPGPDTRDALQAEQDKGKKHGLAHKGEQQGAI
ncbi:hypothetical protein NBRC10512_001138 [Rhodotorula toruloides]|uniref:RHTO0S11e01772g1_1 n=2 Tax=Rhodotorula toruloides TaxID=5286 RepID=A0A061BCG0_RHOTO|nr:uncharacterized protein RHTO_03834 [Rhodotorula toruloides NP11]EMS20036.1 hypothetical protein RHTO_03834 [Rhodotorula toruloides NP11]CDR45539.1 RHTO0S11e01772g1_1 [Rhodotorula toruloides]